jgi:undecaprenyl-diphosphatase
LDYSIDHAVNQTVRAHPLLGSVVAGFADWGVLVFGVAACAIWLLSVPGRSRRWKAACAAGLSAAALGLIVNQVVSHLWDRARPYEAHPHGIVPLLTRSSDSSFPSDHATAAFAIGFGIFFVHRRAGWVFLAMATLIAASRVLSGMHYPTDVLAGGMIGLGCGYLAACIAMRPLLLPLIALASMATDPVTRAARETKLVRATLLDPHTRARIVLVIGLGLLAMFAFDLRSHLFDEMEVSVLAAWGAVVLAATKLAAGERFRLPR